MKLKRNNKLFVFLSYFLFLCSGFFFSPSYSLELSSKKSVICEQKRATGLHIRSLRIHEIPKDKKKEYVTVYSKQGVDKAIAYGKWFGFVEKVLDKTRQTLEESLWKCHEEDLAGVFYPVENKN